MNYRARANDLVCDWHSEHPGRTGLTDLELRIAAALEAEREACAALVEAQVDMDGEPLTNAKAFARTIRGGSRLPPDRCCPLCGGSRS